MELMHLSLHSSEFDYTSSSTTLPDINYESFDNIQQCLYPFDNRVFVIPRPYAYSRGGESRLRHQAPRHQVQKRH